MRLRYFKSKLVSVSLIFVLLLQSCASYHKSPVSIEEAVTSNNKVLVFTNNDTKLKLKKIELIDGKYYGISEDADRKIKRIPLNESDIKAIRVLDKSASTWGTIGIVAGSLLVIIGIIGYAAMDNMDLGISWEE
jgi:hypothetical protein